MTAYTAAWGGVFGCLLYGSWLVLMHPPVRARRIARRRARRSDRVLARRLRTW